MASNCRSAALKAVLFDMDGLLVDSEPLWFEVEHAVMSRLGGDWTPQDQQALVGGSLHRSVDYLLDRASRPASHDEVAGWLVGGMADLLAEREAAMMPGAIELLGQVAAAGIPRVLVTSSERVIMDTVLASLAKHDIAFTATVCGADVRHPKPDPEPYRRAAARDRCRSRALRRAGRLAERRRFRAGGRLRHGRRARRRARGAASRADNRGLPCRRRPGPA